MHSKAQIPVIRQAIIFPAGLLLTAVLTVLSVAAFWTWRESAAPTPSSSGVISLPLAFEPNMGQADSSSAFVTRASGGTLYFTSDGVTLALSSAGLKSTNASPGAKPRPESVDLPAVRMSFVDAEPSVSMKVGKALPGKVNYLLGNNPSNWQSGIPTYGDISYQGIYPGIDLRYEGVEGRLKGTYTVGAHGDPLNIRWRYTGASHPTVDSVGNLVLIAGTGSSDQSPVLVEQAPVAWQERAGASVKVDARYSIAANGTISFALGKYDPALPLIIDPVLTFSTYLGGSATDEARSITTDSAGNVYVVGFTESPDFPNVASFQPTYRGNSDAFITKLSPDGSAVLYSTYLGGTGLDQAYSIVVDNAGNMYVGGTTYSTDFPVAAAFQGVKSAASDAFLTKLNPTGSALIYSTFLGGSGEDGIRDIALDSSGSVYSAGYTFSLDFPLVNPLQAVQAGSWDVFVTKMNPAGSALVYSTYIGGGSQDEGESIAVDSAGNAYVAGFSRSGDYPTVNPFQATNRGGRYDGYVSKLNPSGSALVYSTYLGGISIDVANGIAVDANGSAYVTGGSGSFDFPIANAAQPLPGGNFQFDAYITKFSPAGNTIVYSTFLGGGGDDEGREVAIDAANNVYVTGFTYSTDFPVVNALRSTNAGDSDAFVTRLNSSGLSFDYSTYLGGTGTDVGWTIASGPSGNTYVAGTTASADFPVVGAYQPSNRGGTDGFVARIFETVVLPTATSTVTVTSTPTASCTITFSDVPSTNTFYTSIRCLACRGIISGYSDGTFRPNNPVTRGQLAKIVSNSAGFSEPPTQQTFEDVPPTNTFYQWIERLTVRGYMTGYACGGAGEPCVTGKPYFRPNSQATRGQTAKIVSNAAGFNEPVSGQTFEDVPPTHTFYDFIQRLANRNVMGGYPCGGAGEPCVSGKPYFRPGNDVTRGQSSKIVANAFFPDCVTP